MSRAEKLTVGLFTSRKYVSDSQGSLEKPLYTLAPLFIEDCRLHTEAPFVRYRGRSVLTVGQVFAPYFCVDASPLDLHAMSLCQAMEDEGLLLINSTAVLRLCGDKYLSLQLALRCGVPVPRTTLLFLPSPSSAAITEAALELTRTFSYPFIIKPRGLLKAIGIFKVESWDQLVSILQIYQRAGMIPLAQEFIPAEGSDYRLYFMDGHLIAGYRRRNPSSFISNTSRSGLKQELLDSVPEQLLAWSAAVVGRLPGAGFVAVDFLQGGDRVVLNEIEAMPGFRSANEVLFTARFAEMVRAKVERAHATPQPSSL